jgi:hypothetical protein
VQRECCVVLGSSRVVQRCSGGRLRSVHLIEILTHSGLYTCIGQSVCVVLVCCRPYFGLSMARARAVISGRFFRVLPQPAGCGEIGEDGGGYRRESSRVPFQAGDGWRQRAGVRQLPTGDMLTLEEGFHRAFEVGDLDILFAEKPQEEEPQEPAGAVMVREEAWQICASCDAQFPFLLAAYQHFTRAGWRVASGLKYGATYLLYPTAESSQGPKEAENKQGIDDTIQGQGAAKSTEDSGACGGTVSSTTTGHAGHAPFAVFVLPPNLAARGTACPTSSTKRKRASSDDEADGSQNEGLLVCRRQGGGEEAAYRFDGSEAWGDWTTIQSFTRLAAHVSKKFIIAYASYSCRPRGVGDGAGGRNRGGGSGGDGGEALGLESFADMSRINIREFHLNRWHPAPESGRVGAEGGV